MSIYLIAGGAGFLGAALAARLGHAGHLVRVLDDLSAPAARGRADELAALPTVAVTKGDVRDAALCRRLCAGAEFVLHFAAPSEGAGDDACVDVILGGTRTLLAVARDAGNIRRVIVASSSAVYGDAPSPIRHEASLPDPDTPRACALLSAEHFCRAAFRRDGTQAVCLRFFDVYGPGMDLHGPDASPLAPLLRAAAEGEAAVIAGDGGHPRDYLSVEDAVEATLRAAAALRGVGGKVFNVGTGRALTDQQVRETLERLTGRRLAVRSGPPRSAGARPGRADTAAAAGLLQFTAAVTPDDGLARTLQWVDSNIGMKELCNA